MTHKIRFLIVDDGKVNRLVLNKMLEPYGDSDQAEDGFKALQLFEKACQEFQFYDLVFLDLYMPDMDGFEVLNKIHQLENSEPQGTETRIVLVTGIDEGAIHDRLVDLHYDSILHKPVQEEQFHQLMNQLGFDQIR